MVLILCASSTWLRAAAVVLVRVLVRCFSTETLSVNFRYDEKSRVKLTNNIPSALQAHQIQLARMPGKLTHQQGQMLLHSFSDKSAFSPYHAAACRSKPLQAALATCTVPVHLEDTLMGEDARGAHETTILAPRRTLSDVLKERTNDSLSLSRSSSSNSENELLGAAASKEKGNDTESIPRANDTEAKGEQSKASRIIGSNKMKALENLALPQLHAAVKMALEIRRRRGLEAASKAEQPRQELPDDKSVASSPTAKQAAQTLTSMMASRGTDAVREEQQNVSVADDGNNDGSSNNTDLPRMQESRKRKHDFQPSPSRLRRMSSLATEMSRNSIDGNPVSAPAAIVSSNPTPETTQQQEHQAPDMRRTAIVNSAAIRVFKAARQARMMSSASFCDDATSVPRPSVMPVAPQAPQQEPTRRQADINRVWEAAVRVFLASHAQQQQQGAQANSIDCASMQNNNAPRSSDPAWTDAMRVEHKHLFKAIAESRRRSRAGCL